MSGRKSRTFLPKRESKRWKPSWGSRDDGDGYPVLPVPVAPPIERRVPHVSMDDDERAIISLLVTAGAVWSGDALDGGMTTAAIGIRASNAYLTAARRRALSERLSAMRKRGLLHYEFDHLTGAPVRWWAMPEAVEAATR